jgi:hypothetical protein
MNKPNPFADLDGLRRATEALHLDEVQGKPADTPRPRVGASAFPGSATTSRCRGAGRTG